MRTFWDKIPKENPPISTRAPTTEEPILVIADLIRKSLLTLRITIKTARTMRNLNKAFMGDPFNGD
jgi:hypothetical protein